MTKWEEVTCGSCIDRHADEAYQRSIALLENDGDLYAAILMRRIWSAQKEIEALERSLEAMGDESDIQAIESRRGEPRRLFEDYLREKGDEVCQD